MSAPINSTPSVSALAGSALSHGAAETRPQVQSRRMSLQLGPFGISYATDQVLWTAAVAGAAASATESATSAESSSGPLAGPLGQDKAEATAADPTQAQQEAQQAGNTFRHEMFEAWRRQVQERAQSAETYGPKGVRTGEQARGLAGGAAVDSPEARQDASATATESGNGTAQQTARAPASRVRQAISAYLACAQNFGARQPMLTAVA